MLTNALKKLADDTDELMAESEFCQHVLEGLNAQPKQLSPKYFYDQQGSVFFDQICELEEYYPYRHELRLLPIVARDLSRVLKSEYSVVEFGAGSLLKIRPLLDWIRGIQQFIPIDISGQHLREACAELALEYPRIQIRPIEGDFTSSVELGHTSGERLGFFPGSTIGNFTPEKAKSFLCAARDTLGERGYLIVGVDTKKSPDILHKAYNDELGITAKFNLNLLTRINRELGANIAVDSFEHYAHYDVEAGCIKMHLVSLVDQEYHVAGQKVVFRQGESIHTESSYKYSTDEFSALAQGSGWQVEQCWLAERGMFSMFLLRSDKL